MIHALTYISAVSFLYFGFAYLTFPRLRSDFERYRLTRFRIPIACLQLVGAVGQLVGLRYPPLGALCAAGFALMMLIAVGVRIRIGDSIVQSLPALVYLIANIYLLIAHLRP